MESKCSNKCKVIVPVVLLLLVVGVLTLLFSFRDSSKKQNLVINTTATPTPTVGPDMETEVVPEAKVIISDIANQVLGDIETENYVALGDLVHPKLGVDLGEINFDRQAIQKAGDNTKIYEFDTGAASGLPEKTTLKEFLDEKIFCDVGEKNKFIDAAQIYYNEFRDIQSEINNSKARYGEEVIEAEYFYSGTEMYAGHDFCSLQLMFLPDDGNWYLAGVEERYWVP